MALVPLGSGRLATVRTREVNAMLHKNSVFHQLLKHMPWPDFEDQFAAGDLPCAVNPPQDIPSCTDVEILLGLRAAPVHDEVGVDLEF
jgi:hypothetical protein